MTEVNRDYVRGLNDACQAVLLETEAWHRMAAEPTRDHNNRVVCKAIAKAMADLTERMVEIAEKLVRFGAGREVMADRTSAALFADLLEEMAQEESPPRERVVKLWARAFGYDFHPCQMSCDDALIKLGLARRAGEDGEIQYAESDGTFQ